MKNLNFITGLNWRQLLVHFFGSWFFIYAFQTFSYLNDTKLLDIISQSKEQDLSKMLTTGEATTRDLAYFVLWTNISGFAGLLVAAIISLGISIKKRWFWGNTVLILVLTYFLLRFNLLGWVYLKKFFLYFGCNLNNSTAEVLLNGTILLAIGLLIFFSGRSNRFIENKKMTTV